MANLPQAAGSKLPAFYQIEDGDPQSGGAWDPKTKAGLWNAHATIVILALEQLEKNITDLTLAGQRASPAGSVIIWAADTAPAGYLECAGAVMNRESYADLFAAIGIQYGAGNGSSTFTLPDLRGVFIRGWDNGLGIDAGRIFGSSQSGSLIQGQLYGHGGAGSGNAWWADQQYFSDVDNPETKTINAGHYGKNYNHENFPLGLYTHVGRTRPENIAMMFCIKY